MKQLIWLVLLFVSLLGCSDAPTQSWRYTQQGAFSGAINSDGTRVLVGSIHHGGSLWDTRKNARLFDWNHRANEYSQLLTSTISSDDAYALTADNKTIVLWDTQSGESLGFWTAPGNIYDMALMANGEYALLGMDDFTAVIFNAKFGGIVHTLQHAGPVSTVAVSSAAKVVMTGSQDLSARLWDARNGKQLQRFEHQNQVNKVALSLDGSLAMSVAYREKINIWDTQTGKLKLAVGNDKYTYSAARFSDDNRYLIVGTTARLVLLYDLSTGKEVNRWKMPLGEFQMYASSMVLDVLKVGKNAFALLSDGQFNLLRIK